MDRAERRMARTIDCIDRWVRFEHVDGRGWTHDAATAEALLVGHPSLPVANGIVWALNAGLLHVENIEKVSAAIYLAEGRLEDIYSAPLNSDFSLPLILKKAGLTENFIYDRRSVPEAMDASASLIGHADIANAFEVCRVPHSSLLGDGGHFEALSAIVNAQCVYEGLKARDALGRLYQNPAGLAMGVMAIAADTITVVERLIGTDHHVSLWEMASHLIWMLTFTPGLESAMDEAIEALPRPQRWLYSAARVHETALRGQAGAGQAPRSLRRAGFEGRWLV